jgi:hypothetical protein
MVEFFIGEGTHKSNAINFGRRCGVTSRLCGCSRPNVLIQFSDTPVNDLTHGIKV